jgi:hypothetical protein
VANSFIAATTHSERLQWVGQPEEVGALMEEFYTHGPGFTETITNLSPMNIPTQDGRAIRFVEAAVLDAEIFEPILLRHDLMEKWQKFHQTYLER